MKANWLTVSMYAHGVFVGLILGECFLFMLPSCLKLFLEKFMCFDLATLYSLYSHHQRGNETNTSTSASLHVTPFPSQYILVLVNRRTFKLFFLLLPCNFFQFSLYASFILSLLLLFAASKGNKFFQLCYIFPAATAIVLSECWPYCSTLVSFILIIII